MLEMPKGQICTDRPYSIQFFPLVRTEGLHYYNNNNNNNNNNVDRSVKTRPSQSGLGLFFTGSQSGFDV